MGIKSPVSWIGGKFQQRKGITNLLPPHEVYVELYGGGMHVLLHKPPSKVEVYNDLNQCLVNFWLVAREHNQVLIEKLDSLPYSRALYQQWKNEPLPDDPIDKAVRWFYILCGSFASKYGSGWSYSIQKSHAQEFRYSTALIKPIQERLKNVLIECLDFRKIIEKYDSKEIVFFCDPPYLAQSSNEHYYGRKHNKISPFTEQDHRDLAGLLNNIKGKAIVCYYPHPLIEELYPKDKWNWSYYKKVLTSKRVEKENGVREFRDEIILLNYHLLENLFSQEEEDNDDTKA